MRKFEEIVKDAVEGFKSSTGFDPVDPRNVSQLLRSKTNKSKFISQLAEGLDVSQKSSFVALANNSTTEVLSESTALGAMSPVSAFILPLLLKAWPSTGCKEVFPTIVANRPAFTQKMLVPYIIDPISKEKFELPSALARGRKVGSSQTPIADDWFTFADLNAKTTILLPAGCPAPEYAIDPVLFINRVKMSVTDNAGANPEEVEVVVNQNDGGVLSNNSTFKFNVSAKHSTGHVNTDVIFGAVDFLSGEVVISSARGKSIAAKFKGKIDSSNGRKATEVTFAYEKYEVKIGTAEKFESQMPHEFIKDTLAVYNLDGALKLTELLTETINLNVDNEAHTFIEESYDTMDASLETAGDFELTFNVAPPSSFAGTPTDWLKEIDRALKYLGGKIKDSFYIRNGKFTIICNNMDADIIPNLIWDSEEENDSDWRTGKIVGRHSFSVYSTSNMEKGEMYIMFNPSSEEHVSYKYYPYSYTVEQTGVDRMVNSTNPYVPGIRMSKRHQFKEYRPMIAKLKLQGNSGTLTY